MDGVLVIDKPCGPTSHDVVARVRQATGWQKVGHTGTLDPMATGVLALVVGRATRLAQFLSATDKVYEADVRLGWATDTYDAWGRRIDTKDVTSERPPFEGPTSEVRTSPGQSVAWPPAEQLERLLERFRGTHVQTAPIFSAKKTDGVRAYALARDGKAVQQKACAVTVHELSCIGQDGDRLRLRIACSAGFYVRSFAHELGLLAGAGAHLSALRRTRSGDFDLASAVPLAAIEREGPSAAARLTPIDALLPSLPAVAVNERGAARARHGNDLRREDLVSPFVVQRGDRVRIIDESGALLAVAEGSEGPGVLHPAVVVG